MTPVVPIIIWITRVAAGIFDGTVQVIESALHVTKIAAYMSLVMQIMAATKYTSNVGVCIDKIRVIIANVAVVAAPLDLAVEVTCSFGKLPRITGRMVVTCLELQLLVEVPGGILQLVSSAGDVVVTAAVGVVTSISQVRGGENEHQRDH
jgi:hypothetical protein